MHSSVISFRNRNPLPMPRSLGLWHKNVLKCDLTSQALLDLLVVHYVQRLPSCTFSATEDVQPTTQVWHRVASARRPPRDKKVLQKKIKIFTFATSSASLGVNCVAALKVCPEAGQEIRGQTQLWNPGNPITCCWISYLSQHQVLRSKPRVGLDIEQTQGTTHLKVFNPP